MKGVCVIKFSIMAYYQELTGCSCGQYSILHKIIHWQAEFHKKMFCMGVSRSAAISTPVLMVIPAYDTIDTEILEQQALNGYFCKREIDETG
jgi:hypothetical protein